jgi:hypothetical protein
MDGKNGAEQLIGDLLNDPALLQALSQTPKATGVAPAPANSDE